MLGLESAVMLFLQKKGLPHLAHALLPASRTLPRRCVARRPCASPQREEGGSRGGGEGKKSRRWESDGSGGENEEVSQRRGGGGGGGREVVTGSRRCWWRVSPEWANTTTVMNGTEIKQ